MTRPPRILHCTSEPLHFFGRAEELALLDSALTGGGPSVVALVGPGGQGKTAIVRRWLEGDSRPVASPDSADSIRGYNPVVLRTPGAAPNPVRGDPRVAPDGVCGIRGVARLDGLFFWSFYRGKDADLCLREWLAYAEGLSAPPEVSASWCVDRLLRILRRERWAVVLDGAEVVQHESGPWRGRFVHPDLGRLLEDLGSEPMPGVVALTTRFELPTLTRRPFVRLVALDRLDVQSARSLLLSLGVQGDKGQLDALVEYAGRHAKAVELMGTYVVRFGSGRAGGVSPLSGAQCVSAPSGDDSGDSRPPLAFDEEASVARVLEAFRQTLSPPDQDIIALAAAFRDPPTESLLLDYLASAAVHDLVHANWGRSYPPFHQQGRTWLAERIEELVRLRLLERVGPGSVPVIDAHPLVRRGFEHGAESSAVARAGFLRGRPDRRRPASLEDARHEIELFHAHCDAGLWAEADSCFVALENPKHRFLAPGLERDLLLRFFPDRDWRRPPLWRGFGRWRSLAISLEMLGQYEEALEVYRPADVALRGDALLALGRLDPLVNAPHVPAPWQTLWQAYRAHALCLAGRTAEALSVARSLIPVDVYEWVHVFECLLRADALASIDLHSVLARADGEHRWADLARRRMRADLLRRTGKGDGLDADYRGLIEEYERAGLCYERALTGLSFTAWLAERDRSSEAKQTLAGVRAAIDLGGLRGLVVDAMEWGLRLGEAGNVGEVRERMGMAGPMRP